MSPASSTSSSIYPGVAATSAPGLHHQPGSRCEAGTRGGGGHGEEEEADEGATGKRNIGLLTPCEYTRTSRSTVTKLDLPGQLYTNQFQYLVL